MLGKWFKKKPMSIKDRFRGLLKNKEKSWQIFNKLPVGLYLVSPNGDFICNDYLLSISGIKSGDDMHAYYNAHLPRLGAIMKMLEQQDSIYYDYPLKGADGSERFMREHVVTYKNDKGDILYYLGYLNDITGKKIVQDNLKDTNERLSLLAEELPIGIFQLTTEGKLMYANQYLLNLLGVKSIDDFNKEGINFFVSVNSNIPVLPQISVNPHTWSFETETRNKLKEPLWLKLTGRTVFSADDTVLHFFGYIEDVTIQKSNGNAFYKKQEKREQIADLLPETVFEVDATGNFLYINKEGKRVFGYKDNETPSLWDLFAPESLDKVKKKFFRAKTEDYGTNNDYIGKRKDGSKFPITVYAIPVFEKDMLKCYRGILINNAERSRTEEKYKLLIEKSNDGIIIHRNGSILFANQVAYDMFGYKKGEIMNLYTDLIHPDEEERFISYHLKRLQGKAIPNIYETIFLHKDNKAIPVELNNSLIEFDNEKAVMSIVRDLTQRNRAESELLKLGAAVNQIHEAIVITDINGVVEYVNPAFEKLTFYQSKEVIGRKTNILKSGKHDEDHYLKLWNTIVKGDIWSGVFINKRKDDELYEEHCVISPIKNNLGKIVNFIAVKRNITDERRIEKQMRQTQKLQAIGTLAGGIAHDFNNLLMAMQLFTELTQKMLPYDHKAQDYLSKMLDTQARGKDLISQILNFSRNTDEDYKEPLLIHYAVNEALKIIKSTLPSTVKINESIIDCGYILGNLTHIQQIMMNLCTNASQAMEGNGILTIQLEPADFHSNSNKSFVRLIVKDTGCGMDRATRERIFEPFFTTKKVGVGTGLGMTTIHSIVKQYGGELFFSSEIGKGTAFYIYLPLLSKK